MAKCKFGAIVTDMRGKLGGHVLQGNGFANTIRTGYSGKGGIDKIAPSFKNMVSIINKNWLSLSDVQKQEWHELALELPIKDILGDQLFLTGQNFHRRNYTAFYATNQTGVIDPTAMANALDSDGLQSMSFNLALGTISLTLSNDRVSPAYMFYGRLVNNAKTRIQPEKLRFFVGVNNPFPDGSLIYDAFINVFRTYVPGQAVQFGVAQVNEFGYKSFVKTVYATYVV